MLVLFIKTYLFFKLIDPAIYAHTGEALSFEVGKELGVFTFAAHDHRGKHKGASSISCFKNLVYHLVCGLTLDHPSAFWAVRNTDASKKQAQIIIDLCNRAHSGTRVFGGGFLVDRHRRRQSLDGIYVGLVHLP